MIITADEQDLERPGRVQERRAQLAGIEARCVWPLVLPFSVHPAGPIEGWEKETGAI